MCVNSIRLIILTRYRSSAQGSTMSLSKLCARVRITESRLIPISSGLQNVTRNMHFTYVPDKELQNAGKLSLINFIHFHNTLFLNYPLSVIRNDFFQF